MKKSKFIRVILKDGGYFIFNRKKVLRVFRANGFSCIKIQGMETPLQTNCDFEELCKIVCQYDTKSVIHITEQQTKKY